MATGTSRVEKILQSKINGEVYTDKPLSRVEELLINLNTGSGGGGESTEALTKEVINIKNDVSDLNTEVNGLIGTSATLGVAVATIQTSVTNLTTAFNENNDQINNIQNKINAEVPKIQTSITNLTTSVNNLKEHAILDGSYVDK